MAKREEKATFCARFVHDRGAALVIRHDLSGGYVVEKRGILGVLAYRRTWDTIFTLALRGCVCVLAPLNKL